MSNRDYDRWRSVSQAILAFGFLFLVMIFAIGVTE